MYKGQRVSHQPLTKSYRNQLRPGLYTRAQKQPPAYNKSNRQTLNNEEDFDNSLNNKTTINSLISEAFRKKKYKGAYDPTAPGNKDIFIDTDSEHQQQAQKPAQRKTLHESNSNSTNLLIAKSVSQFPETYGSTIHALRDGITRGYYIKGNNKNNSNNNNNKSQKAMRSNLTTKNIISNSRSPTQMNVLNDYELRTEKQNYRSNNIYQSQCGLNLQQGANFNNFLNLREDTLDEISATNNGNVYRPYESKTIQIGEHMIKSDNPFAYLNKYNSNKNSQTIKRRNDNIIYNTEYIQNSKSNLSDVSEDFMNQLYTKRQKVGNNLIIRGVNSNSASPSPDGIKNSNEYENYEDGFIFNKKNGLSHSRSSEHSNNNSLDYERSGEQIINTDRDNYKINYSKSKSKSKNKNYPNFKAETPMNSDKYFPNANSKEKIIAGNNYIQREFLYSPEERKAPVADIGRKTGGGKVDLYRKRINKDNSIYSKNKLIKSIETNPQKMALIIKLQNFVKSFLFIREMCAMKIQAVWRGANTRKIMDLYNDLDEFIYHLSKVQFNHFNNDFCFFINQLFNIYKSNVSNGNEDNYSENGKDDNENCMEQISIEEIDQKESVADYLYKFPEGAIFDPEKLNKKNEVNICIEGDYQPSEFQRGERETNSKELNEQKRKAKEYDILLKEYDELFKQFSELKQNIHYPIYKKNYSNSNNNNNNVEGTGISETTIGSIKSDYKFHKFIFGEKGDSCPRQSKSNNQDNLTFSNDYDADLDINREDEDFFNQEMSYDDKANSGLIIRDKKVSYLSMHSDDYSSKFFDNENPKDRINQSKNSKEKKGSQNKYTKVLIPNSKIANNINKHNKSRCLGLQRGGGRLTNFHQIANSNSPSCEKLNNLNGHNKTSPRHTVISNLLIIPKHQEDFNIIGNYFMSPKADQGKISKNYFNTTDNRYQDIDLMQNEEKEKEKLKKEEKKWNEIIEYIKNEEIAINQGEKQTIEIATETTNDLNINEMQYENGLMIKGRNKKKNKKENICQFCIEKMPFSTQEKIDEETQIYKNDIKKFEDNCCYEINENQLWIINEQKESSIANEKKLLQIIEEKDKEIQKLKKQLEQSQNEIQNQKIQNKKFPYLRRQRNLITLTLDSIPIKRQFNDLVSTKSEKINIVKYSLKNKPKLKRERQPNCIFTISKSKKKAFNNMKTKNFKFSLVHLKKEKEPLALMIQNNVTNFAIITQKSNNKCLEIANDQKINININGNENNNSNYYIDNENQIAIKGIKKPSKTSFNKLTNEKIGNNTFTVLKSNIKKNIQIINNETFPIYKKEKIIQPNIIQNEVSNVNITAPIVNKKQILEISSKQEININGKQKNVSNNEIISSNNFTIDRVVKVQIKAIYDISDENIININRTYEPIQIETQFNEAKLQIIKEEGNKVAIIQKKETKDTETEITEDLKNIHQIINNEEFSLNRTKKQKNEMRINKINDINLKRIPKKEMRINKINDINLKSIPKKEMRINKINDINLKRIPKKEQNQIIVRNIQFNIIDNNNKNDNEKNIILNKENVANINIISKVPKEIKIVTKKTVKSTKNLYHRFTKFNISNENDIEIIGIDKPYNINNNFNNNNSQIIVRKIRFSIDKTQPKKEIKLTTKKTIKQKTVLYKTFNGLKTNITHANEFEIEKKTKETNDQETEISDDMKNIHLFKNEIFSINSTQKEKIKQSYVLDKAVSNFNIINNNINQTKKKKNLLMPMKIIELTKTALPKKPLSQENVALINFIKNPNSPKSQKEIKLVTKKVIKQTKNLHHQFNNNNLNTDNNIQLSLNNDEKESKKNNNNNFNIITFQFCIDKLPKESKEKIENKNYIESQIQLSIEKVQSSPSVTTEKNQEEKLVTCDFESKQLYRPIIINTKRKIIRKKKPNKELKILLSNLQKRMILISTFKSWKKNAKLNEQVSDVMVDSSINNIEVLGDEH